MTNPLPPDGKESSIGRLAGLVIAAIAVASGAHFFLDLPTDFLREGRRDAWLGLSVWAPSLLASVALFMEVGLKDQLPHKGLSDQLKAGAAVLLSLGAAVLLIHFHIQPDYWRPSTWMESVLIAAALHTALFMMGVLFWQGLVQGRLFVHLNPFVRAPLTALLGLVVWAPFIVQTGWERAASGYLLDFAIIYFALALIYELGLQVRFVMGCVVVMALGYTWAHQGLYF
ncbi:MAG: hypothetical protein ACNA8W_20905 [Bradymonadaceae bacterium]